MNKIKDIFIRYLIILLIALPNLFIFYFLFTPLTIYPLFLIFNIFFRDIILIGNSFFIKGFQIEIIGACVAASAYYLLTILNLSIPNISIKKRIKMISFAFLFLLSLNILRIFFLSVFFVSGFSFFDFTHKLFWYLGTTVFVVLIWFIGVKKYNIKEIPIYSDIKFLISKIRN